MEKFFFFIKFLLDILYNAYLIRIFTDKREREKQLYD